MFFSKRLNELTIFVENKDTLNLFQRWAWYGIASPKDFCPRDLSPEAQYPGTISTIFIPVLHPGICVPLDDFETVRIHGTLRTRVPGTAQDSGIFFKDMIH